MEAPLSVLVIKSNETKGKSAQSFDERKFMSEKLGLYKCSLCGNIVEAMHAGDGQMICCGKPMDKLAAKTADVGKEKHVPVTEKLNGLIKVRVGSIPHPMEEKHYIEWVQIMQGDKVYEQFLKPGQVPEAVFELRGDGVVAMAYCNIHGLWKGE
jgi:superoxide reductase